MKRELDKAIGIFIGIAGLVGVIAQLLTTPTGLRTLAFRFLFVTLLVLGIWIVAQNTWRKRKASQALPRIEQLEDISAGYQTVQASVNEVDWIARLEAQVYTPADAIPKHTLKEWYNCNPTGFSVIKMKDGRKIGHIDILPIRPATLKTFLEGNIVEKDIRGDSLYSPKEKHLIQDLYVESIIVLPPKGFSNAPAVLSVLTNFAKLVERICDPANVGNIYAIAASESGERLLKRLGFDPIVSSQTRADHHDLFAAKFVDLATNITAICGVRFSQTEALNEALNNKKDGAVTM